MLEVGGLWDPGARHPLRPLSAGLLRVPLPHLGTNTATWDTRYHCIGER